MSLAMLHVAEMSRTGGGLQKPLIQGATRADGEWQTVCSHGPAGLLHRMSADRPECSSSIREGKYTNCFQIGHNAFEFLLEFGQSYADHTEFMHTRLVTSPAYAALLSQLLMQALSEYQDRFGPISLDGEPYQGTPGG